MAHRQEQPARHTQFLLPLPDHIGARPDDLWDLMEGMSAFDQGPAQNLDAVIFAAVLESCSRRQLPLIKWESTESFNVRVLNDTGDFYPGLFMTRS